MKKIFLLFCFTGYFFAISAQSSYRVTGGVGEPLLAESKTGVDAYLLNGLTGAQISFTANNAGVHQWYKYRAGIAVAVASLQSGNTSTVSDLEDGYGYYVEFPANTQIFPAVWIIDYSRYRPKFFGIEFDEEYPCEYLNLFIDFEADMLYYESPSGTKYLLQRHYTLSCDNLEWDEDAKAFLHITETLDLTGNISEISLDSKPLQNTVFTLTGDSFAEHFGSGESVSAEYAAVAVEAHATAETLREYGEAEFYETGTDLGGSAPVEYVFTAYANEPVAAYYIWDIKKREANGAMTSVVHFPNSKILTYNFEYEGNYVVELQVTNSQLNCVDSTQVFNVVIGETFVKIPNAFSPGSSAGINDEFRISYRSVVAFRASIFNRWGNLLFRWTDPAKGWDGRVNGKFVPTGVYYVVVEYTDSKGKKHTESSDVNILRSNGDKSGGISQ
jgi:gliding motility-associated-like protein